MPVEQVDAVIVGAGAGGGVMAKILSTAGLRTVLFDRGPHLTNADFGHDELADFRPMYDLGLKRLEELAKETAGKAFADLEFAQQSKVLEALEKDSARLGDGSSRRDFFELVRTQTIEGFFGDPKYGGNRDQAGWKMLKFEP